MRLVKSSTFTSGNTWHRKQSCYICYFCDLKRNTSLLLLVLYQTLYLVTRMWSLKMMCCVGTHRLSCDEKLCFGDSGQCLALCFFCSAHGLATKTRSKWLVSMTWTTNARQNASESKLPPFIYKFIIRKYVFKGLGGTLHTSGKV